MNTQLNILASAAIALLGFCIGIVDGRPVGIWTSWVIFTGGTLFAAWFVVAAAWRVMKPRFDRLAVRMGSRCDLVDR